MAAATEYRQLVSVFLASPGDLAHEREVAKAVVTRLNKNFSRAFNLTVELVIWEDVPSSYGRPQEIINRDHLARCELFVGMLNQRWGTPTGDYSSGFAEEFALSEQSLLRTGRPAMSMLFKAADEARIRDPGEDFKKILAFKEQIKERILHHTFDGDTAFKEHIEDILYQHVLALKREQDALAARDKQVAVVHGEDLAEALSGEEDVPQLPRDSVNFLRAFASKASGSHHAAALAREEVARFRLLATLVSSGNDDAELGVHDANALFDIRAELDLNERECAGLVDAGIVRFKSENVPYWYWLMKVRGLDDDFISLRSVFGSRPRRIGALRLMRLLRLPLHTTDMWDRRFYRRHWFDPAAHSSVREAALDYLACCGVEDDLEAVRAEVDKAGYETQKAATRAYVLILARRSTQDALHALVELDYEGVTEDAVDAVFARPETLKKESLTAATSHRTLRVRHAATAALRGRKALNKDLAEQLSNDDAPIVRLEALQARAEAGEVISDEAAKAVLVQNKSGRAGLGSIGFLGLGGTKEGEAQFEEFKRSALQRIPTAELKRRADEAHIFDQGLVLESIRRAFAKRGGELRAALDDGFKAWFERELAKVAGAGVNEESLNKVRGIEDELRKEWTRAALDIVAAQRDPADLQLVRGLIADKSVKPNRGDMLYLAEVGEWSDLPTILSFSEELRGGVRRTIVGSFLHEEDNSFIAQCLCGIAKTRLFDLLGANLTYALRPWVVRHASPAAIKALTNAQILNLLRDQNDTFRRVLVLRAIASLPATRVTSLFRKLMADDGPRYYNVTLWLDMAASVGRSQAVEIAKRALVEHEH